MTDAPFQLFGHDDAKREIQTAFGSGRMHHAWLLCGIEGIGKATLAKQIAAFVLAGGKGELGQADPQARATMLVEAESHPDMLIIRRPTDEKTGEMKNIIPVEEVLKVTTFLHKTATDGGWRVVILEDAQTLNRNGQNAILKIVEEPPARTLILITVTTPGALLPTIRSRCRLLQLQPLSDAHMRAALTQAAPKEAEKDGDTLIPLAGGSIGFAMKMIRTETMPLYREMLEILNAMPQMDTARVHKLADQIARKADSDSFDVISQLLIDRLRNAAHEEAVKVNGGAVETALALWERTRMTFSTCDRANLDRKLAFVNIMNDIRGSV